MTNARKVVNNQRRKYGGAKRAVLGDLDRSEAKSCITLDQHWAIRRNGNVPPDEGHSLGQAEVCTSREVGYVLPVWDLESYDSLGCNRVNRIAHERAILLSCS